jgi:divalent metal cation (Fe/Co/Zn/Cd) transporter
VATVIAYNGIELFLENLSFLLGAVAGAGVSGGGRAPGSFGPRGAGRSRPRAEYTGPDTVQAGMHIEVRRGLPIEEADRIAEEVRERVHQCTESGYCIIHVDPTEPD